MNITKRRMKMDEMLLATVDFAFTEFQSLSNRHVGLKVSCAKTYPGIWKWIVSHKRSFGDCMILVSQHRYLNQYLSQYKSI